MNEANPELGDSWIDQFIQYSEDFPTPYIYRKWCAIAAVAAAMERKVSLVFNKRVTYPNMYTVLVGKPGTGKTTAMHEVYNLLSAVGVRMAPKSTTAASLYDAVAASVQSLMSAKGPLVFSSLACVVDELAVWMPMYDNALMGLLSSVWDNPAKHDELRRTKDLKPLEAPGINLLIGVQPAYLGNILPPTAHEQGILARCILVYCETVLKYTLTFGDDEGFDDKAFQALTASLKRIKSMIGEMTFSEEAKALIRTFYHTPPPITDLKFENYNARRIVFIAKLGMIASAAMGNTFVISGAHMQWAIDSLCDVEVHMPEVHKEMRKPESSKVMIQVYSWARALYSKTKQKPIPKYRLISVINSHVTPYEGQNIFKAMLEMKYFVEAPRVSTTVGVLAENEICYIPLGEMERD